MHRAREAYQRQSRSEEALLVQYASLVERVGRLMARRTGRPETAEELWSAGALGLLEASRRFDPARGVRFETFAEHRIRGAMLDELRRGDSVPRRTRARAEALERVRERLAAAGGGEPTADEVARAAGLEVEEVAELEQLVRPPLALDAGLEVASGEAGAEDKVQRAQLAAQLARAVGELPERLQFLLSLYYVEELTYREIARLLEVSEPRVCQLHGQALKALREKLAAAGVTPGAGG